MATPAPPSLVHLLMDELRRLLARYNVECEEWRSKVFPLLVKGILKALGEEGYLREVELGRKSPHHAVRELVEKYFLLH